MMANIAGFMMLFLISAGMAVMVYFLFRKPLKGLLKAVIKLPAATTFYLRMFLICLSFLTLSAILQTTFDLEKGKPFMEFVWKLGSGLSTFFGNISIFLLVYLFLITILVVVLRRKNVQ